MTAFYIIFSIFLVIGLWVVYDMVRLKKERKKMYEQLDEPAEPYPVETHKVTVVDKYNKIVQTGSMKQPKSRPGFFVTFKLENGNTRTYEVDERYFRRINNGAKGELAISDGKFMGFSRDK